MRIFCALLLISAVPQTCLAWHEGGHHLIAELAYDLLKKPEQQQFQTILKNHPRFALDFVAPPDNAAPDASIRWVIGRAGYWPDIARAFPDWTRPTWHYQLGSTLNLGEVNPPKNPGPVPADANLGTQELYIAQAVELCRTVLRDKSRQNSDRAVALCWLAHLVGDAHQPCHAGSLYVAEVFPEGDRGANSILTTHPDKPKPLHLVWDGLLGSTYDSAEVKHLMIEITSNKPIWGSAIEGAKRPGGLDPLTWLAESAEYGRTHVYGPEVLAAIEAARRGSRKVEIIDLSEEYLQAGRELARVRAAFAAHRLASILQDGLK